MKKYICIILIVGSVVLSGCSWNNAGNFGGELFPGKMTVVDPVFVPVT